MAKNLVVINVDFREIRVALIEGGIIAELHIERASTERCLGDVVLGRVTRVLPGMQAAFIDVGLDKAAFLHVEDLIRPDDFEAYLSGNKRAPRDDDEDELLEHAEKAAAQQNRKPGGHTPAPPHTSQGSQASQGGRGGQGSQPSQGGQGGQGGQGAQQGPAPSSAQTSSVSSGAQTGQPSQTPLPSAVASPASASTTSPASASTASPASALTTTSADASTASASSATAASPANAPTASPSGNTDEGDAEGDTEADEAGSETGAVSSEGGNPAEKGIAGAPTGRRRRRRKPSGNVQAPPPPPAPPARATGNLARIDKHTPIRDVVREGQEVLVQISKEPIGTKGARVTSHITLPGRYVVYTPTVDYVGVSKRIGSEKERSRLREAIDSMRPPTGGLIVRTVAEGLTKKQMKADVGYLVRLWGEIAKKREGTRAPTVLYQELDLILKVARDMFGDDIEKIVIDDRSQYERLVRFVDMFMPERVKDVELYEGDEPIFDEYGIEEEISRSLSRKVPLPSGGYLIIDEAEALTAIDVNTGRFVGKGSKDHEETIIKTNLEAVEEIAYQLRFRNLGGLIVLDLIDMERASSREQIRRRLEELLQKDKAKTSLNRVSELGLIEMTRKRTRESLGRLLHEACPYCDGTGQIKSRNTIVYEILRAMTRDRTQLPGYTLTIQAHPEIITLMKGEEKAAVADAEKRFQRRIELIPRKEFHLEQYELSGR